jgi:hypothetical protein
MVVLVVVVEVVIIVSLDLDLAVLETGKLIRILLFHNKDILEAIVLLLEVVLIVVLVVEAVVQALLDLQLQILEVVVLVEMVFLFLGCHLRMAHLDHHLDVGLLEEVAENLEVTLLVIGLFLLRQVVPVVEVMVLVMDMLLHQELLILVVEEEVVVADPPPPLMVVLASLLSVSRDKSFFGR